MPKVTLHASEETHQAVLPQRPALEPVPVDNPRVGTKRGMGAGLPATGVQHGRGETGAGPTCPPRRHRCRKDEPGGTELGRHKPPVVTAPKPAVPRVFVLGRDGKPLHPCHPAQARRLLASGRARVARHTPFVVCLTDKEAAELEFSPLEVRISPGSRRTGIALVKVGQDGRLYGLFSVQVGHRGQLISKKLRQRAAYRRRRRSANLRYRAPRFVNGVWECPGGGTFVPLAQ